MSLLLKIEIDYSIFHASSKKDLNDIVPLGTHVVGFAVVAVQIRRV